MVYQQAVIGSGADSVGFVSYSSPNEVYARIGARLSKDWQIHDSNSPLTNWTRLNLWHAFVEHSNASFSSLSGENPVTLSSQLGYSWAQLSIGTSRQLKNNIALFASGDVALNFDGGNGQVWSGRMGAKYVF